VLLKNDGTLPWDAAKLKTVAILGPTGDDESVLLGNYHGTPSRMITLGESARSPVGTLGVNVLAESAVPLVEGYRISGQPFRAGFCSRMPSASRPGWRASLRQSQPGGAPIANRTDARLICNGTKPQPALNLPATGASLRWTGVLVPPAAGEYILSLTLEARHAFTSTTSS